MPYLAVIKLIHSLSKAEKRQFKLFSKKQSGNKDYLALFDLIEREKINNEASLKERMEQCHPDISLDNTARYLLKVLTDCLIRLRVRENGFYQLLYGLLRVNILKERNLPDEAFNELNKLQNLSVSSQDGPLRHIIYREKLDYFTNGNFNDITERELVTLQMKTRDNLKNIRNTQEHSSLYELLKYRLVHSKKILSSEDRKQLNDLLLSEMSLVNARAKNNMESRKLHLLFQSFFFTNAGDYKSALKTFYELNRLFEKNNILLKNPPIDYFSSLDGILDSLRTNGYFDEMNFYIQKINDLDKPDYPEYFRFLLKKTILIYQISSYLGLKEYDIAIVYINKCDPALWKEYIMVDENKQNELLFYLSRAWFHKREYKKSQKLVNEIILTGKINYNSLCYRAAYMLNMIINYENKELEQLDYQIRSYKRSLLGKGKILKIEGLLCKTIGLNPDFNKKAKNQIIYKKISPLIKLIENDKYESHILKYFDFVGWVKMKFKESEH